MRKIIICFIPVLLLLGACQDPTSGDSSKTYISSAEFDGSDYDKIIVHFASRPSDFSVAVDVYNSSNTRQSISVSSQSGWFSKATIKLTGDVPSGGYAEIRPSAGNTNLNGTYTLYRR